MKKEKNISKLLQNTSLKRIGGDSQKALSQDPYFQSLKQNEAKALSPHELTTELWNELQGTWIGSKGWNIIAVPSFGSKPSDEGKFELIVQPFTETLTFTDAGAPARNRGGSKDQFIAALEYHQRVSHKETDEALHVEDGMFMNLSAIKDNDGNLLPIPKFNVARSGTIPHGDSIMLLGPAPILSLGPPDISKDVTSIPPDIGESPRFGYEQVYRNHPAPINVAFPNLTLIEELQEQEKKGQKIIKTITMSLDSENSGGILNIPFIVNHANATRMQAVFWLEKVKDENTQQEFDQLQYTQIIDLVFHRKFGSDPDDHDLIIWPHITINTLIKQ